jgi:hypothetical protein
LTILHRRLCDHTTCTYLRVPVTAVCRTCGHPQAAHSGKSSHYCLSATADGWTYTPGDKRCTCGAFLA